MAIAPKLVYPGQLDETDPVGYPHGKAQNETSPGDDDGTPLEQALVNDIFGFQQALLGEAGLTPSGTPDTAVASQYLQALKIIAGESVLRAPFQAVASEIDTGLDTSGAFQVLLHCIHASRKWLIVKDGSYCACRNGQIADSGISMGFSDDSWNDAASDATRVVVVGDAEAIYNSVDTTDAWAACTGGIAAGSWRAIVHDGTNFVAGNAAGQFSYSAAGVAFSSVVSGGANWLAGGNAPAQIAVGKGPGGVNPRIMAVAKSGTGKQYFAYSDNNGVTWSNTAAVADITWLGIAYRASDHLWVAIGSSIGGTSLYTSSDGGNTWTLRSGALPSTTPTQRLFVFNDHFVTMNSTGILYASDPSQPWYRGARVDHEAYSPKSLVVGNGRLGWLMSRAPAAADNIFLGLSQAGDQSWKPQLS